MKKTLLRLLLAVALGAASASAPAHTLNTSRASAVFDASDRFTGEIDVDLTAPFGSGEAYYQFSILPKAGQEPRIRELFAKLSQELKFEFGGVPVPLELTGWEIPQATRQVYNDYYTGKMSRLFVAGRVPPGRAPFTLESSPSTTVMEFPLALTVERPDRHTRKTRWLETPGIGSEPYDFEHVEDGGLASATPEAAPAVRGAEMSPLARYWVVQLATVGRYLKFGFRHIVPEGTDHILFVLGLFFFGLTWRKLLSQTTVFTLAHATTLYLSTQGIFSLPSQIVEPGIAFSIAFIAVENVLRPRLSPLRLAVVFFFGLVHGLGFAQGLKELRLPQHELLAALVGFNFGVDFGQLFVIGVAFLLVGWFRNRPWYFQRIAVPGSLLIAAIGLYWMVERILFYAHLAKI